MSDTRNDSECARLLKVVLVFAFYLICTMGGYFMGVHAQKEQAPVEATAVDPRIGEDLQELSKRTVALAEFAKKQQQQIEELYQRDEQIKAFIENLYRGAQPQSFIDKQASK
jgi:cell division protein FtsB